MIEEEERPDMLLLHLELVMLSFTYWTPPCRDHQNGVSSVCQFDWPQNNTELPFWE